MRFNECDANTACTRGGMTMGEAAWSVVVSMGARVCCGWDGSGCCGWDGSGCLQEQVDRRGSGGVGRGAAGGWAVRWGPWRQDGGTLRWLTRVWLGAGAGKSGGHKREGHTVTRQTHERSIVVSETVDWGGWHRHTRASFHLNLDETGTDAV